MKNYEIARLFDRMADLLEVKGENRFRIRAYRRAALNIESLTEDIEVLAREQRLEDIPGIGSDLAGKIMEYLTTGRMLDLEATQRGIPPGVVELMSVPGIGPKTAKLLYEREGVVDLRRLEDLARAGKLRGVPGIQAKTEENILKGLVVVKEGQARPLPRPRRLDGHQLGRPHAGPSRLPPARDGGGPARLAEQGRRRKHATRGSTPSMAEGPAPRSRPQGTPRPAGSADGKLSVNGADRKGIRP